MKAAIDEVIVNGSPIVADATYHEQLSVVVRGVNLWSPIYEFVKADGAEGVPYAPLGGTSDEPLYILMENGTYRIYVNGKLFRTIIIEGVVVPSRPYSQQAAYQSSRITIGSGTVFNRVTSTADCLNYPYKANEERRYFLDAISMLPDDALTIDDISCINASVVYHQFFSGQLQVMIEPSDPSIASAILIRGFIRMVCNYEQQRRRRR